MSVFQEVKEFDINGQKVFLRNGAETTRLYKECGETTSPEEMASYEGPLLIDGSFRRVIEGDNGVLTAYHPYGGRMETIMRDDFNQIAIKLCPVEEDCPESEKSTRKGYRNENEASNILGRVFGSGGVEKVDAYSNHDPFGLADIIAIKPGQRVLFVQVKTNELTSNYKQKYKNRLRRIPTEHIRFQVWVRVDYKGWVLYEYDPEIEEFDCILEMDTCDVETTVEAVRDEFDFWEEKDI